MFINITNAQNPPGQVYFRSIGRDSINLPLTDGYEITDDSSAQIIRYSHFNFQTGKFFGKFTDVSKFNPNVIISEGSYSTDGLKDGSFTVRYLNGNLRAKGDFKDDKYNGKWEIYYNDGKPELTFEVVDGECHIIDAWDPDSKKEVANGNGIYIDTVGSFYWIGKLLNGKPDGTWKLLNTGNTDNEAMATEHFKKGQFHDGSSGTTDYNNISRIDLVGSVKLPFINAEKMYAAPFPSNGSTKKHVVNAQYKDGAKVFSGYISDAVLPYLRRVNQKGLRAYADISGEVSENGTIINLDYKRPDPQDIARGLSNQLRNLPPLQPATVDGKPVKQKFTISFRIYDNTFDFTYFFLGIEEN